MVGSCLNMVCVGAQEYRTLNPYHNPPPGGKRSICICYWNELGYKHFSKITDPVFGDEGTFSDPFKVAGTNILIPTTDEMMLVCKDV